MVLGLDLGSLWLVGFSVWKMTVCVSDKEWSERMQNTTNATSVDCALCAWPSALSFFELAALSAFWLLRLKKGCCPITRTILPFRCSAMLPAAFLQPAPHNTQEEEVHFAPPTPTSTNPRLLARLLACFKHRQQQHRQPCLSTQVAPTRPSSSLVCLDTASGCVVCVFV